MVVAVGRGVEGTGTEVAVDGKSVEVGTGVGVEQDVKRANIKKGATNNMRVLRWYMATIVNQNHAMEAALNRDDAIGNP